MTELLNCPFCGGEAQLCVNKQHQMFWVLCKRCYASPGDKRNRAEAITAWNTRPCTADERTELEWLGCNAVAPRDQGPNDLDRKAAAEMVSGQAPDSPHYRLIVSGGHDSHPAVQAFARHRLTAERDTLERAAVIAESVARDCPTGTIEHAAVWDAVHKIRAAKEQVNG